MERKHGELCSCIFKSKEVKSFLHEGVKVRGVFDRFVLQERQTSGGGSFFYGSFFMLGNALMLSVFNIMFSLCSEAFCMSCGI